MVGFRYRGRREAGQALAEELVAYADRPDGLVLALPRGGVPVAYEVARRLHLPLDVYAVRKLGVPGHEELAMGALAADGSCVLDRELIATLHIPSTGVSATVERELAELRRRETAYRDGRPEPQIANKSVILVDDGLATGSTMLAAVAAVRTHQPAAIVVAVPVGSQEACAGLRAVADRVVCPYQPEYFGAVGMHYENFGQTGDDEVRRLLGDAAALEAKRWKAA
ncbi:MAG TPA: phosphoribosyltransferase [Candidatus Tyrphobacter sp.]